MDTLKNINHILTLILGTLLTVTSYFLVDLIADFHTLEDKVESLPDKEWVTTQDNLVRKEMQATLNVLTTNSSNMKEAVDKVSTTVEEIKKDVNTVKQDVAVVKSKLGGTRIASKDKDGRVIIN